MSGPILAVDAQYDDARGTARVGALWFTDWPDADPCHEAAFEVDAIAPYAPGQFYLRELPCIEEALTRGPPARLVLVDGYVDLGPARPGLGRHVHTLCGLPVVGVAKSRFHDAEAVEVLRGGSSRPLYVTAVGLAPPAAADALRRMHGPYRMPTLLKRVDQLARGTLDQ